jgi:hypothetical protein
MAHESEFLEMLLSKAVYAVSTLRQSWRNSAGVRSMKVFWFRYSSRMTAAFPVMGSKGTETCSWITRQAPCWRW